MTSEELADQVTACIESIRSRIIGTGDKQYSAGDRQTIELKSSQQLINEAIEEVDDLLVYAAVLRSRLGNLRLPE
jgi:hypothetical protein